MTTPPQDPATTKTVNRRTLIGGALLILGGASVTTYAVARGRRVADGDVLDDGSVVNMAGGEQRDLKNNLVLATTDDTPTAAELSQMNVQDAPGRFVVPSVGLDVPLREMTVVGGTIKPPSFTKVYLLRGFATPATHDTGTVYAAMHSVQYGYAPGNALIDVGSASATVGGGDKIVVDGHTYRVLGARTISKSSLKDDSSVWSQTPNRLVIITCMQRGRGKSLNNVVIEALWEGVA